MMELVNGPVPLPSVVQISDMVGLPIVFQQTPLTVTGPPPPVAMILPPPVAVMNLMPVTAAVVTAGTDTGTAVHDENVNEPIRVCQFPLVPFV